MNCEQVRNLLDEYLDGELAAAQRASVDEHLAGCAPCRAELEILRNTATLVGSLPRVKAPKGLTEDIKARLVSRPAAVRSRRRPVVLRWVGIGGWVAAAATLIVVIKLAPWEGPPAEPAPPPRPPAKIAAPAPELNNKGGQKVERELKYGRDAKLKKAADEKFQSADAGESQSRPAAKKLVEKTMKSAWARGGAAPAEMDRAVRAKLRRAVQAPPKPAPTGAMDNEAEGVAGFSSKKPMTAQAAARALPAPGKAVEEAKHAEKPDAARREAAAQRTLTYVCADLETGLAEVRKALAPARATIVTDVRKLRADKQGAELVISLPVTEFPRLISALKLRAPAKDRMKAGGAALGASDSDAAAGQTPLGRSMNIASAGRGTSSTVTVRILLKPELKR